jgi:hypothetical protein
MRILTRKLLPAAAAAAFLLPLAAQPSAAQPNKKPNIRAVEVVVRNVDSREDIGTVQPGGTITLPQGAHVRLVMTALPVGSSRGPVYPATTFTDQSKGGVRITRSNSENSTADLDVLAKASGQRQAVRFQIQDDWVPADLRSGTIYLQVGPSDASTGGATYGAQPPVNQNGSSAEELTRMLYKAILMREPDPGAQGTTDAIARGGYDALVNAAAGIANSSESRNRIPGQGVSSEDRLAALYQNLLGISPDRMDRSQYESDLRRVTDGRIADVVTDMLRSERFRSSHNLTANRY